MRKGKRAALAVSLVLALTGQVKADPETQLERCQRTLTHVGLKPLTTLEFYPQYLLHRIRQSASNSTEAELAQCEQMLWQQVQRNLEQQSALVSRECQREQRIPADYHSLQTYYMGIANLACDADWFIDLGPVLWRRVQPMLAELNTLEVDCYEGLEAIVRGGEIRIGQARALYRVISLSRKVFQRRWQSLMTELEDGPRLALTQRERQLRECEALLKGRLEGAD